MPPLNSFRQHTSPRKRRTFSLRPQPTPTSQSSRKFPSRLTSPPRHKSAPPTCTCRFDPLLCATWARKKERKLQRSSSPNAGESRHGAPPGKATWAQRRPGALGVPGALGTRPRSSRNPCAQYWVLLYSCWRWLSLPSARARLCPLVVAGPREASRVSCWGSF